MTQQEKTEAINGMAAEINDYKRKLRDTDYVVTRGIEQGTEISAEFKAERQSWRDAINGLEDEIAALEAIEPDEPDTLSETAETDSDQGKGTRRKKK